MKKSRLTGERSRGPGQCPSFRAFDIEFDQHRNLVRVNLLLRQQVVNGNSLDFVHPVAGSPEPVLVDGQAGVTLPVQEHFLSGNGVDRAMIDRNRLWQAVCIASETARAATMAQPRSSGAIRTNLTRPLCSNNRSWRLDQKNERHRASRAQKRVDFRFVLPVRIQQPVPVIIVGWKPEADAVLEISVSEVGRIALLIAACTRETPRYPIGSSAK